MASYDTKGYVYFVQAVDNGPVKIGWTKDHPDRRLKEIRMLSPVRVVPLGVIRWYSRWREGSAHLRFGAFRLHGEWFEPSPELLDYIAKRAQPWPEADSPTLEPTPDRMRRAHERELEEMIEWALSVERIRRFADDGIEYHI